MNPALLHAVESEDRIDLERAEDAAHELLLALGEDPQRDGLRDTPRRIAKAYAELLSPEPFDPTTFPNDEGYDELVVARDIPFQLALRAPPAALPRRRPRRLPPRRPDPRPVEARPASSSCSPAAFRCRSG